MIDQQKIFELKGLINSMSDMTHEIDDVTAKIEKFPAFTLRKPREDLVHDYRHAANRFDALVDEISSAFYAQIEGFEGDG